MCRFIYIPSIARYKYINYLAVLVEEREKIVGGGACEGERRVIYDLSMSSNENKREQ
jgi:hypothetical protein